LKKLFTPGEPAAYDIPFPPAAPAGISDFAVSGVALLSYTAAGASAGGAPVTASDVTVGIPGDSVAGTARFAIEMALQQFSAPIRRSSTRARRCRDPQRSVHAFRRRHQPDLQQSGVTAANMVVADETHLSADVTFPARRRRER